MYVTIGYLFVTYEIVSKDIVVVENNALYLVVGIGKGGALKVCKSVRVVLEG